MNRKQKKEQKRLLSTRQLMGIDQFTENGLKANRVQVQEMTKPLTISGVFPQIFEGESGVNVKV